jgi:hypothetical protein
MIWTYIELGVFRECGLRKVNAKSPGARLLTLRSKRHAAVSMFGKDGGSISTNVMSRVER